MIRKLALSLVLVGLIVLGGIVLPVAGVASDPDPITPCPTETPEPSTTPDRPPIGPPTPRPSVQPPPRPTMPGPTPGSSDTAIFGRVWDVCLDVPGVGVQVYIVAGAVAGATPFGEFQQLQIEVMSPDLGFLRLRSAPDSDASEIATVMHGAILTVLDSPAEALAKIGQEDAWIRVRTADGQEGYVAAWYTYYEGIVSGVTPTYVMTTDAEGNYGVTGLTPGQYTVWLHLPEGWIPLQPPLIVSVAGGESVRVDLNYCGMIPIMPETGVLSAAEPASGAPALGLLFFLAGAGMLAVVSLAVARRRQS